MADSTNDTIPVNDPHKTAIEEATRNGWKELDKFQFSVEHHYTYAQKSLTSYDPITQTVTAQATILVQSPEGSLRRIIASVHSECEPALELPVIETDFDISKCGEESAAKGLAEAIVDRAYQQYSPIRLSCNSLVHTYFTPWKPNKYSFRCHANSRVEPSYMGMYDLEIGSRIYEVELNSVGEDLLHVSTHSHRPTDTPRFHHYVASLEDGPEPAFASLAQAVYKSEESLERKGPIIFKVQKTYKGWSKYGKKWKTRWEGSIGDSETRDSAMGRGLPG